MSQSKMPNSGQFERGRSGNPAGRPRKGSQELRTPADFRALVMKVANRSVAMPVDSRQQPMSLLEANLLALATGKSERRLSAGQFVEICRAAFDREERFGKNRDAAASHAHDAYEPGYAE